MMILLNNILKHQCRSICIII